MPLKPSHCVRRDDPIGKKIKTFLDSLGVHIQAILLVDGEGDPAGVSGSPIVVSGTVEVKQSDPDDLNANVNLQVGDLDVDSDNPVPTEEQETAPDASNKNNPSLALTYVTGDLTSIALTIDVDTFTKTLAYVAGDLSTISVWA